MAKANNLFNCFSLSLNPPNIQLVARVFWGREHVEKKNFQIIKFKTENKLKALPVTHICISIDDIQTMSFMKLETELDHI